jgi:hypothetical protein
LHPDDFCAGWNFKLEEGTGEAYIRLDIGKAGSGHISQTIKDIHLDHKIGLPVNGQ